MGKDDIDDLCVAISDCLESIDDLVMKIWLRRRLLAADETTAEGAYDEAVQGLRSVPFDVRRLRTYAKKRARRARSCAPEPPARSGEEPEAD